MQSLREAIADIINESVWEKRGDDFYLIDEEEVIDNIIAVVKGANLWPHPFGGNEAQKG